METSTYHKYKVLKSFGGLLLIALFFSGCKKYITVKTPSTSIGTEAAFQDNNTAVQVLTGLYAEMARFADNGSLVSSCIIPELSADNIKLHSPEATRQYLDYYRNSLEATYVNSGQDNTYWMKGYKFLYTINMAIEQLTDNSRIAPTVAKRLLGEAYFMRAFIYFYLINYYGEVPLVLTTKYRQTVRLKKNTSNEVYTQLLTDLDMAGSLLDYSFVGSDLIRATPDRIRPNLAAVNALQARANLYQKNYAAAEIAATKVITQSDYSLVALDQVFLMNSMETIWSLQPVEIGYNTRVGAFYFLTASGPNTFSRPTYASESLLKSFLPGDARKDKWIGLLTVGGKDYRFPAKYKRGFIVANRDISEYTIVFRLAELYLIRAEARNEQNNTAGAVEDLNAIRERSRGASSMQVPNPLPALSSSLSQADLRPIILNDRRVELFTEWGHRWFDLRRSGTINEVMTEEEKVKGGAWAPYKIYFPIPQYDISTNPLLIQTPGY